MHDTLSPSARRDARLRSVEPFEIATDRTSPAGLPKGMSWNAHEGERARLRRLKQLQRQERKDIRARCLAMGIDPDTFDTGEGPERAR